MGEGCITTLLQTCMFCRLWLQWLVWLDGCNAAALVPMTSAVQAHVSACIVPLCWHDIRQILQAVSLLASSSLA